MPPTPTDSPSRLAKPLACCLHVFFHIVQFFILRVLQHFCLQLVFVVFSRTSFCAFSAEFSVIFSVTHPNSCISLGVLAVLLVVTRAWRGHREAAGARWRPRRMCRRALWAVRSALADHLETPATQARIDAEKGFCGQSDDGEASPRARGPEAAPRGARDRLLSSGLAVRGARVARKGCQPLGEVVILAGDYCGPSEGGHEGRLPG